MRFLLAFALLLTNCVTRATSGSPELLSGPRARETVQLPVNGTELVFDQAFALSLDNDNKRDRVDESRVRNELGRVHRLALLADSGSTPFIEGSPSLYERENEEGIEGSMSLDIQFEGELVFGLESKHILTAQQEIGGSIGLQMDIAQEMEGQELPIEITIEMNMDGESQ